MDIADDIFYTVIGEILPEYAVPGVRNLFAEGEECSRLEDELAEACNSIRERLGQEDEALEQVLSLSEQIMHRVAIEMYLIGRYRK